MLGYIEIYGVMSGYIGRMENKMEIAESVLMSRYLGVSQT